MSPLVLTLLFFALGFTNGLRTLTPVAVLCWGVFFGWYSLSHTPFVFLGNTASLAIFTVLALGEMVADKLPKTPARTTPVGVISRVLFAGASGAVLASVAGASIGLGIVAAIAGAVVGTYIGYYARRALTTKAGLPDLPVALVEDVIAVGGALLVVSRF